MSSMTTVIALATVNILLANVTCTSYNYFRFEVVARGYPRKIKCKGRGTPEIQIQGAPGKFADTPLSFLTVFSLLFEVADKSFKVADRAITLWESYILRHTC